MKKLIPFAIGAALLAGAFAAVVKLSIAEPAAAHPVSGLDEGAVIAAARPDLSTPDALAAGLNSAGDSVYATLVVDQIAGSGILTLPLDGGIFTALTGAADGGMTAGGTDGSSCITASTTTGAFTIADTCGTGVVELLGCLGDIETGNTGKTVIGAWTRTTSAGVATQLAPKVQKTEIVDAGASGPLGCAVAIDTSTIGNVYTFTLATSGASAATATTKSASLFIHKIRT